MNKAIIKRSELKSKYLKIQTQKLFKFYKKQLNFCSSLYKRERKKYYNPIDFKNLNDSRQFGKTVKPFLPGKGSQCAQINLVDQDNVISDDKNLSKEFGNLFGTALKTLDFKKPPVSPVNEDSDPIDIALTKYVDHPSILKIKEYFNEPTEFNFSEVITNDIQTEIKNLDSSKKGSFKNITPKSLKKAADVYSPLLCNICMGRRNCAKRDFSKVP